MSKLPKRRVPIVWADSEAVAPFVDQFQLGSLDKKIFYFFLGQMAGPPLLASATRPQEEGVTLSVRPVTQFAMGLDDVRVLHQLLGTALADVENSE